jgi:hypothetical protein
VSIPAISEFTSDRHDRAFERRERLQSWGPKYEHGAHTIAQIVNAAANYWKHQAEWYWSTEDTRRQRTVAVLSAVLGEEVTGRSEYVTATTLHSLIAPGDRGQDEADDQRVRFADLLSELDRWRESLASTCSR